MLNLDTIGTNIRTLVRELLGMAANTVRPADQNAPTGNTTQQFATVKITMIQPTGQDDVVFANVPNSNNVTETIDGQRLVMASVNFYRGDAFTKVSRLPGLLSTSAATARMRVLGLGLVGTSQARNLTAIQDTLSEERGQIDLTFHVAESEVVTIATYGTFEVDVSTADANGNTTTQTFGVFEP